MCITYGPFEYEMTPGKQLTLWYDPDDPSRNCLFTFSGFYLSSYSVLPIMLLILWGAFYLSFNYYRRTSRSQSIKPTS